MPLVVLVRLGPQFFLRCLAEVEWLLPESFLSCLAAASLSFALGESRLFLIGVFLSVPLVFLVYQFLLQQVWDI